MQASKPPGHKLKQPAAGDAGRVTLGADGRTECRLSDTGPAHFRIRGTFISGRAYCPRQHAPHTLDATSANHRENAMGLFSKDIETMDDLLLHGLQDIYYAENQIIKSLPKLIEKATNRDLTKGLKDHLEETKNQVARLDQVFKKLGQEPKGVQCPAI